MNDITLQSRVAELLLQWPSLRPVLAESGLAGLRDPDHWPSPAITVELAAHRHRLDAAKLLQTIHVAVAGQPAQSVTDADRQKVASLQHECHCGGH
jgi:hypothetical protein